MSKHSHKVDTHHLLWPKAHWDVGYAKKLRDHWYMSVEIPRNTLHQQIHRNMSVIPLPSGLACKMALEQLIMLDNFGAIKQTDPIEKRLATIISILDYVAPHTVNALKKQLDIINKIKYPP